MKPDDFRWHVAARQPPGTSDTSRFATDHINNPNAINTIFNLSARPTASERLRDGTSADVHHILKDGADSIGVAGASLRVYVNIGMCGEYWVTRHDPVLGIARKQQPFEIDHARKNCEDWRNTEARMANAEAFLKTMTPPLLKDAPGGKAYLTAPADTLRAGRRAFAENCASCHSSKQPPAARPMPRSGSGMRSSARTSSRTISSRTTSGIRSSCWERTSHARWRRNATRGRIWEQFSSETYKAQPPVGQVANLYNPQDPTKPLTFEIPGGGRGYYRTPTLTSIWATAPYLHNNSVGIFVKDPTVQGRMTAYTDGMREAAVAGAPPRRSVDSRHDGRQQRDHQRHHPPCAHSGGHAG